MSRAHSDLVKSATLTATGTMVASAQGRILGIGIQGGASGGSVTIRDGGAGGTALTVIGASAGQDHYVPVPEPGMVFATDVHATIATLGRVTIFFALDTPMSI